MKLTCLALSLFLFFACKRTQPAQEASVSLVDSQETISQAEPTEDVVIDSEEVPVAATPSEYQGFQVVGNQRFGFNIDIPSHWSAVSISEVGDGFLVKVPGFTSVEIRVYGEEFNTDVMQFYDDACIELDNFIFSNDLNGKRCLGESDITYWLDVDDARLNVYIKNWDELDIAQKSNFTTMVKSLRIDDSEVELPS